MTSKRVINSQKGLRLETTQRRSGIKEEDLGKFLCNTVNLEYLPAGLKFPRTQTDFWFFRVL